MILLIFSLLCLLSASQAQDLTQQPFAHGSEVVEAVVDLIRENCIFPEENRFLRRWAYVKTRDGTLPSASGVHGGIWKITKGFFQRTKNDVVLQPYLDKINKLLGRNWLDVQWPELVKPLYSGLAAVLITVQQMHAQNIPRIPPEVELQGNLWFKFFQFGESAYNYTATVNLMNQGCKGNEAIDMVFIIDSSSSVNPDDLVRVKAFMTNIIGEFNIGNRDTRIAVIRYSTQVTEAIRFSDTQTQSNIIKMINDINFEAGSTNTAGALDKARITFTSARSDAVKVAVLVTDGKSDDFINTKHSTDNLKADGIAVFTVGVGKLIDQTELNYISSSPACTHTYTVADFQGINALVEEIQHSVCRAPLYANFTVTCEIGRCPPYAFPLPSIGLTIQANITCGGVTVYSSVSQAYPGVAASDKQVVVQYYNESEFYQPGVENQKYLYVKPEDHLIFGNGPCLLTLTPFQGQLRHTVYIYCEENGVRRNCTEEELCPGGKVHNSYNPCTKENLATGKTRFPYPGDNTKFYICQSSKAIIASCPEGEVFAPQCQLCYGKNQPVITNCNASNINSKFDGYCTTENILAGKYYFTHPLDIHLYIQCDPWGNAYVMSCEGDLIWQETKLSCEKRDTLINPCLHMDQQGNERFYAYPLDFHKFIECNDFLDPLVMSCPAGLMWSDCIKTCMQRARIPNNCFIDPNGPLASYIPTAQIPP
ncbi:hypothetical protein LOTGIDRAFT_230072 [Lottia gigantea]|uniref:VWFA domain-containing protein n=1 Tax=Lottia gigantea TaxID=225164 RepID=V4BBR1_LOTGI|nr:hypothetical protein LOTGIDRAFT_230072 [Lottia gigantea]ESP05036.1 hypothetical protein LOTGIDRAFT_230072 [Lottia gigantea]